MAKKRAHILSAVNAANVSKANGVFTIKGVCGAVNDIVMNRRLYPGEALAKAVNSMDGKPAPAGHPKNSKGQHISALNGEALASSWIGSYCTNSRHEGGKSLFDVVVNEAQALAHPKGKQMCERLDAAIAGTNAEPIHVSTGLYFEAIAANGESLGKKYETIVTNIEYDHLAILVDEQGAGTPEQGVGMFLNSAGEEEEIEMATVNSAPEDKRSAGLKAWLLRLLGNGSSSDVSFDQITSELYALMSEGSWIRDVFDRYVIWTDRDGKYWRQDYSVSSDGSVAFSGVAVEVTRKVDYEPISNQEDTQVKVQILAALNAAGIKTEGLSDDQLLDAYNALVKKPGEEALNAANVKLTAANAKIAEHEQAANAVKDAELTALATELATNSVLKVEDFKAMGLERCKELKTNAKAAPILPANGGKKDDGALEAYDINELVKD